MSFIIVFCVHSARCLGHVLLSTVNSCSSSSIRPPLISSIYAGVAAVAGLEADADLRPRGSSSESSSLGGRLSSWRRFLRLLVICPLSASWHFEFIKQLVQMVGVEQGNLSCHSPSHAHPRSVRGYTR